MFYSKKFSKFKKISHCFFSKKGGFSRGIYKSLNCGVGSNDNKNNIKKNLSLVSKKMGINFNDAHGRELNRFIFWLFLLLFIPCALSILFSMNTWFGSTTQYVFLKVHFYSGIGMLLLVILHFNFSRNNKG